MSRQPLIFSRYLFVAFPDTLALTFSVGDNRGGCLAVGLVRGDKLSVDGTFVEANASKESRIPREQLAEAAQIKRTVRASTWLNLKFS
jgi:hypothetical protein